MHYTHHGKTEEEFVVDPTRQVAVEVLGVVDSVVDGVTIQSRILKIPNGCRSIAVIEVGFSDCPRWSPDV